MNLPRKPFEPLPPRDGELRRVRRRALLRRARVPGSGAAVVLIAVLAYSAAGTTPQAADRLQVTEAPTGEPSPSPAPSPSPTGTPGAPGLLPSPEPSPSDTPTRRPSPRPSEAEPSEPTEPSPSPAATHISGVVQNDALAPMRGVLVHAQPADGWGDGGLNVRLVTRTDANGRWTLPCGTPRLVFSSFELYRATSSSPGAYHYSVVAAPACGSSLTTRLGPGSAIAGRVIDQRGEPVHGSRVVALFCAEDSSTPCQIVRTDAEGRYAFHGLHAGRYEVALPGTRQEPVQVGPRSTTTYDPVLSETGSPSPSASPGPTRG